MSRTKVKPQGIIARKDGDQYKRFPNGLKAILKAVRKCWAPKRRTEFKPGLGRSPSEFARLFKETYNRVGGYYKEQARSAEAVAASISKLEGSGEKNISDVNFWKIRAYAEFVELPTSLFLLFAQLISYESQGRSRQEIRNFLANCLRSIRSLENYIAENSEEEFLFHRRISENNDEIEFIALLVGLYGMSEAFGGRERRLQNNDMDISTAK